jgi:hypothetical protein
MKGENVGMSGGVKILFFAFFIKKINGFFFTFIFSA